MPGPLAAGIIGSVGSAAIQANAAGRAQDAQTAASNAQIAEARRQFDTVQRLLSPYVEAGSVGLKNQMALMGVGGQKAFAPRVRETTQGGVKSFTVAGKSFPTMEAAQRYANANKTGGISNERAQERAIGAITDGAQFQELTRQGEYGLLANTAATGGLRGGDTQAALAQFRPALLQGLIDRQLANFGGLAANGQNAAAQTGTAAQNAGQQVNAALGDRGAAAAGSAIAQGQAWSDAGSGILQTLGGLAQPMQPGGGLFQQWKF